MPGQVIASEEEYIPGANTFLDSNGNIISTTIGLRNVDNEKKEISVLSKKNPKIGLGDIIYGKVFDVKDKMILIFVNQVFSKTGVKKRNYIGMCALFVSNISNSYLENIKDSAKIGDIICGEITKMDNGIVDISTKKSEYGVVLGYSKVDRSILRNNLEDNKKDIKDLFNINLKVNEKRKVSSNYIC